MNLTKPNTERITQMHSIALLSKVEPNALRQLLPYCRWRRFNAEQQIIAQGEQSSDVYFVTDGEVRIRLYAFNGREVTFRDAGSGDMFGELAAIDGSPRSTFVTALTDGEMMIMQAAGFLRLLESNDQVANDVMAYLARRVRFLSERVFEFSSYCVKDRVRAELLRIAYDSGKPVDGIVSALMVEQFPTHAEIANRISTHREAVTREINALVRRGLIERSMEQVVIRDTEALQRLVGQDSLR